MIETIAEDEIKNLMVGGKILAKAISEVKKKIRPGMSSQSLDEIAENSIRIQGGLPSFKNYAVKSEKPFPSALCVSINHQIVHGVPLKDKVLKEGDIVSLDLGCRYKNLYTDMAITVGVGKIPYNDEKLINATRHALTLGIKQAKIGNKSGDIGSAIEQYVSRQGFSVVRDLVGHGVGRKIHQLPNIPNFGESGIGEKLVKNLAIAIEPMVTAGSSEILVEKDGWTVSTKDQSRSAHFEQTILISGSKPIIITPFL